MSWRSGMLGIEGEAVEGPLAEFFGTKEGVLIRNIGKGTAADRPEIDRWLAAYDAAWADFRALPATSQQCATLYREEKTQHQKSPGIDEVAKMLRR